MTDTVFVCWQCGAALSDLILPLSRREECKACRAELHVCRMCQHYDSRVADQCREDRAETVTDKSRANFCDYFALNPQAYAASRQTRSQSVLNAAEALFGNGSATTQVQQEPVHRGEDKAQQARDELKKLFGDD